ncbi:unnamed protein product [Prorocentrum cordatum]|uniref:FAD synthase n=1 Tax=Prorocentrum cordatum TaxID=2364126 RepID=A0ABN9WZP2_9DINO|nr:unnamed protein product [Polarella glacialis]
MMRPRVLVLAVQDDFGEVQELIRHTVARYELQAVTLEGGLIAGLADCVRDHALARSASATAAAGSSAAEAEGLPLAWVMGTREGDPHGSDLETFSPTSEWMPPGMRVNPILRWDYGQVWSFLRGFELPYCSLYDFGYTSIGSVGDTFPNPFLRSNSSATVASQPLCSWPPGLLGLPPPPPHPELRLDVSGCTYRRCHLTASQHEGPCASCCRCQPSAPNRGNVRLVRRSSGLPTQLDERVLDFESPVFVGCLRRALASSFRVGRAILLMAPSGPPESPEPESHVSPAKRFLPPAPPAKRPWLQRPSGVPAGLPAAAGALGPGERAGRSPGRPSAPARAEVAAAGREL